MFVSIMSDKTRQRLSLECECIGKRTISYRDNFWGDGLAFVRCNKCRKRIDFKWDGKIKRIYYDN